MLTREERAAAAGAAMRWPPGRSTYWVYQPGGVCWSGAGYIFRAATALQNDPALIGHG